MMLTVILSIMYTSEDTRDHAANIISALATKNYFKIFIFGLAIYSVIFMLWRTLSGNHRDDLSELIARSRKDNLYPAFHQTINELKNLIFTIQNAKQGIDENDRKIIVESILDSAKKSAGEELLGEIKEKVGDDHRMKRIDDYFYDTRQRIINEISSLLRRGKVNLIIGILLAVFGVYILWSVLSMGSAPTAPLDPKYVKPDFIMEIYLPRVSMVLMVELLSLFFLRLYKLSHDHIKYYQNELTSLECKQVALMTAIAMKETESVKAIIQELSKTERNFILKKDETTVDLEKARLEKESHEAIFSKVSDLLGKAIPQQKPGH
ncbi:MAG: hypothetical protein HQL51_05995 [Magnetococcales bacterium]|nr:hypothetical protein [Magnetococcales bacterium]